MAGEPDNLRNREDLSRAAAQVLEEAASRLRSLLDEMAQGLRPFPAFLNMVSVQAVELDLPFRPIEDRGCVVVAPDGRICSLDLRVIPEAPGVADSGQVAELKELEMPTEEYILYAYAAIRALSQEMRRRGS